MKKTLLALLVVGGAFFLFYRQLHTGGYLNPEHYLAVSECDQPLKYKIGEVDPKFGISKQQFTSDTSQATQIWEKSYHKKLFEMDPSATLTVNLIFDNRQSLSNQIDNLQNKVQTNEQSLKDQISSFEQRVTDFKNRLNQFNQEVQSWNQKGGAPPDVYNDLIKRQEALRQEGQALNAEAKTLNQNQDVFNNQIDQLNQTIDTFNTEIQKKPEEGLYDGPNQRIEIYFDKNQDELIHTLAHELGHGLGMEHNDNPKSIMYSYSTSSLTPSAQDLDSLAQVCKPHNLVDVVWENIITRLANQN